MEKQEELGDQIFAQMKTPNKILVTSCNLLKVVSSPWTNQLPLVSSTLSDLFH
jgi:hypothetical protein